jgi:DNA ligase-1
MSQSERTATLQNWYDLEQSTLTNIRILEQEEVELDTDEGQQRFREINHDAIQGGYEGIMIKDPAAPYECKRTTSWLKLKPFIEVSLAVVDFEEGTGRNAGRLGAIICEGEDDGRRIRVNVGSGFSDSDRDHYWTGRDQMVKQIVEVRADAVTKNQDGTYSLRFPRFLRFRGFRAGEKI